ncbi:MAG: ABC transporter transmembrane domain-containing protein, partial [Clostridia bacterium]|nr:ABC transporter transmembrane domain-containing protein [Clostridia bacterium]
MKKPGIRRLCALLRDKLPTVGLIIFLSLCYCALSLLIPILTGDAIDYIVSTGDVNFDIVLECMLKIAIVSALTAIIQWLCTLLSNSVALYASKVLRDAAFARLMQVRIAYIDGHSHGDMLSRLINDVERVSEGILMG